MKYPLLKPALEAMKLKPAEAFGMALTFNPNGSCDIIGHLYIHAFGPVQYIPQTADGEPIDYREKVSEYYSLPWEKVVNKLFILYDINIPAPFNSMGKFDILIPPEDRKQIMIDTLEYTMYSGEVDFAPPILAYINRKGINING